MINGLLDVELSVPNPTQLLKFWERRGMVRTDDGVLGTEDRDVQLRLSEGSYRHLSELHMSCETESDLVEIAGRIGAMGVESTITGTRPACTDPVFQHRVVIDVTTPHPLTPSQRRAWNHPGESTRIDERAEAAIEAAPRHPGGSATSSSALLASMTRPPSSSTALGSGFQIKSSVDWPRSRGSNMTITTC